MSAKMVFAVVMACCMFAGALGVAPAPAASETITAPAFAVTALPALAKATLVDSCIGYGSVNYTANGTAWTRLAVGGGFDLQLVCAINTDLTKLVATWPEPGQVSFYLGDGGANFVLVPYTKSVAGDVYLGSQSSFAQGVFTGTTSTGGVFKSVTAVTREKAIGGLAPTKAPASATATAESPYGAVYNFWATTTA